MQIIDHATADRKTLIAATYRRLIYKEVSKPYWARLIGAVLLGAGIGLGIWVLLFMGLGAYLDFRENTPHFFFFADIDCLGASFLTLFGVFGFVPSGMWLLETDWKYV